MKSIKGNLVLWTIGVLAFGIVIVLAATYSFAYRELSRVFDDELRKIAQAVHLREDWLQTGRVRIARPGFSFSVRAYGEDGRVYFETAFPSMPEHAPKLLAPGLTTMETDDGEWRIFTHVAPEGIVQVAQPEAARASLARLLSLRMAMPILLLIPLLAVLVVWVLKRGLLPLNQISRRVSDRDAKRLDPLPTDDVPLELLPLIDQINALLQRLAASLESQRRFIADAAHELRSPVAALALQAQIAERANRHTARAEAFAELRRGIARAGRLVGQLLDLARLDPSVHAPFRQVDIAKLAREVISDYAAHAGALGVDLGAEGPPTANLKGVESELRSLIGNLVDNALRYAPPKSEVTVKVSQTSSAIEVAVEGGGPGIPDPERGRIFERFQRVPGDPTSGSGLGLPIAKVIVERHQGTISLADAHPGLPLPGLAVRVMLPADLGSSP